MQHLSEILVRTATEFPDRIAIQEPGKESLSYDILSQRCSQLQTLLLSRGISQGERVGIFIPKSIDSVCAILATLSSGAAYIPVDAHAPASRGSYIFSDCQAKAVFVSEELANDLVEAMPAGGELLDIPGFNFKLYLSHYPASKALGLPEDLAYMLYTSGSTGVPKGVMITHRNALCFIEWCADQFEIQSEDVFSSIAPFHFDLSIFDLYTSLLRGASMVLINQKVAKNPMLVAQTIADHKINVIYATPTLLKLILNYGKCDRYDHSQLRLVLFAGEVFAIPPLKKLKAQWNHVEFYNLYGPTETNVVTWFHVPDQIAEHQSSPYPIGSDCSYVVCKLWDEAIIEPAPGLRGELIVSGESVAYGYLNLSEKNKQAFFTIGNTLWYKTGDLVEVDENHQYVFIGRKDRMVKRNGYRIELAEIEAALHKHTDIREAGVIAQVNEKEEVRIKAFIHHSSEEALTAFQLKQFCLEHLPMYMLPDQFVFIDEFPKTSTHKIDYQQLKRQTQ